MQEGFGEDVAVAGGEGDAAEGGEVGAISAGVMGWKYWPGWMPKPSADGNMLVVVVWVRRG